MPVAAPRSPVPIAVAGSVTVDRIISPAGEGLDRLGGSAVYAALGARHLTRVAMLGVRGLDSDGAFQRLATLDRIDTSGVRRVEGNTERWMLVHDRDSSSARDHRPGVAAWPGEAAGEPSEDTRVLFLGSHPPGRQLATRALAPDDCLVGLDTMTAYLEEDQGEVERVARTCHVLFGTTGELALLCPRSADPVRAALRRLGVVCVVEKRGGDGARVVTQHHEVDLPAYPARVADPTGAGDALAGAFLGHLAATGGWPEAGFRTISRTGPGLAILTEALGAGLASASVTIEALGTDALRAADARLLQARMQWCLGRAR
ncbi:MAG: PfkB family carbohydrate kinase [Candidatus Dormibacteria bacterium]